MELLLNDIFSQIVKPRPQTLSPIPPRHNPKQVLLCPKAYTKILNTHHNQQSKNIEWSPLISQPQTKNSGGELEEGHWVVHHVQQHKFYLLQGPMDPVMLKHYAG